jgi:predicted ATPase/DNA-binding winged helix-turn-helix (wHTH) protein
MTKLTRQYRFGRFWFDEARRDLQCDGVPLPARTQALDLLTALLAKPGALVSKDELMKAAWPGLNVEEGNIAVQVHYLRNLLQDTEKPYRWIATEPGRGYRFIGALEAEPDAPAHGLTQVVSAVDDGLPDASGLFVGRERELATLQAQMPRHRLVTVTGPGGMGKTRLAIEFAREHVADPFNKLLFLGLEGLRQKDQISFRLAGRLGVQPAEGPQMVDVLADALQKQGYLIIFDNCEHVLVEVATLAEVILQHAPGVSILATSREPLKIAEEFVFPLGPLNVPGAGALSASDIEAFTAVRLFADKAQASDPGFTLSDAIARDVAAICRKMEGIPLALQLAAAQLHALSLPELLNDMSKPGRFSRTASPSVPARHRTVEATIAWSVALLTDKERAALRRLSVFPGRFTMAGAAAVIADGFIDADETADLLSSLSEKSLLITASPHFGQHRFHLLESTRDYGQGMLSQAGEAAVLNKRLALLMIDTFGHARDTWPDSRADEWAAAIEPDIESLRTALDWAFSPHGDRAIGVALAARLRALFSDRLITQREFLSAINLASSSLNAAVPGQDEGWILLSAAYDLSAGHERCVELAVASMACFLTLGDPTLIAFSAAKAAVHTAFHAGATLPNPYRDEALAMLPLVPANRYRSATLLNTAVSLAVTSGDGNPEAAQTYFEQAPPIAHEFNDRAQISLIGANLAELEATRGNYDAAIKRAETLAQQSRSRRDLHRLSHELLNLIAYSLLANRVREARDAAAEAVQLLIDFEDAHWGADYGGRFSMLAARLGHWRHAAKLAGFSNEYHESQNKVRQNVDQRLWEKLLVSLNEAEVAGALQHSERLELMRQGATLSLREALLVAQASLETCEERLVL